MTTFELIQLIKGIFDNSEHEDVLSSGINSKLL